MKISILVAVYNSEKYLHKCLDSLLQQTHTDIEIIAIDDASTDHSWNILQQYASIDNRIVILRQKENGGQAKARNSGLVYATGDYITMVDSDDWLDKNTLKQACEVAKRHPMAGAILFDVIYHDDSTEKEWHYSYRTDKTNFTGHEAFKLSLDWSIHGLYIVKREIHLKYPYDDSCRSYSDDNTTRIHFLHAGEVWRSNGIYYYRQHAASITHAVNIRHFDYAIANYNMKTIMEREHIDQALISYYENHRWINLVGLHIFYLNHRKNFTKQERNIIKKLLKNYYFTIEYHRLSHKLRRKFGYLPFPSHYRYFIYEIQLYNFLRKIYYTCLSKPLPDN